MEQLAEIVQTDWGQLLVIPVLVMLAAGTFRSVSFYFRPRKPGEARFTWRAFECWLDLGLSSLVVYAIHVGALTTQSQVDNAKAGVGYALLTTLLIVTLSFILGAASPETSLGLSDDQLVLQRRKANQASVFAHFAVGLSYVWAALYGLGA